MDTTKSRTESHLRVLLSSTCLEISEIFTCREFPRLYYYFTLQKNSSVNRRNRETEKSTERILIELWGLCWQASKPVCSKDQCWRCVTIARGYQTDRQKGRRLGDILLSRNHKHGKKNVQNKKERKIYGRLGKGKGNSMKLPRSFD